MTADAFAEIMRSRDADLIIVTTAEAGERADKFAGLAVRPGPGGVPVLADCPSWLAVRRTALLDEGGDHVCVVTEPLTAHSGGPFRPLRLSDVGHLVPGHGAAERPDPPTERAAR
jgi:flavin reductase (DIM6/NTAB) family NADH-FMN oxidoreductase RutF